MSLQNSVKGGEVKDAGKVVGTFLGVMQATISKVVGTFGVDDADLLSFARVRYAHLMKPPVENTGAHDPILEALRNAPVGEPLTDDERAELDQAVADIAAGVVIPIRHEDVPAWLEARAREDAALAAE
jgi:hypothetical protein